MPLRSLRDHLFKQRHVEVLVIKQIDGELLHVCGTGIIEGHGSVSQKRRELQRDNHAHAVRMNEGNQVLQPADFNRLVSLEEIILYPSGARIKEAVSLDINGHRYRVAHTPMRCWYYQGHLVLERTAQGMLLSTEDMTHIRAKANRQPVLASTGAEYLHKAPVWRNVASRHHGEPQAVSAHQAASPGTPSRMPKPAQQTRELELEPKF